MHWSRLIDIPIATVILLLRPFLGEIRAEIAAMVIIPMLTLFCTMLALARVTERLFDRETAIFASFVMAIILPVIGQLSPMRIDHHGWQMVMALVALGAVFDSNHRRGGWVAGSALALWLNISMEALPMAGAFMALFAMRWLVDPRQRGWLVHGMAALASVSILAWLAINGARSLAPHCDAIAPAHLAIFAMGAIALSALAYFNPKSRIALIGGFAAVGGGALAIMLSISPVCASGAFAELDPLVRSFWYERVLEGMPIWRQGTITACYILALPMLALGGLYLLIRDAQTPVIRGRWLMLSWLVLASFVISLLVQRATGVANLFALPAAAWLVHHSLVRVRKMASPVTRVFATLAILLSLTPAVPVAVVMSITDPEESARTSDAENCELSDNLAALRQYPTADFLVPMDTGPAILYASDHRIVASSHHRNQAAMADVIRSFLGTEATAYAIVRKRGIEYVGYCPGPGEPEHYVKDSPHGLMAQLQAGRIPAWLKPVDDPALGKFKLWRVVGQAPARP